MSHIFPVLGALKEERKKERKRERKEGRKKKKRKKERKRERKKEREKERENEKKGRKNASKKKPLRWNMVHNISAQPMTSAMNSRTASRMEVTLIFVPPFFHRKW